MGLQFATCDRGRALAFIEQCYPTHKISDTPGNAKELLDWVEKDVVRLLDPNMHGNCQVVPGNNWDAIHQDTIIKAAQQLNETPLKETI